MSQRHPVEALIRHHVYFGSRPTRDELDALDIDAATCRVITAAISAGLALRDTGNRAAANEHALDAARDIVAELPDHQRDPDYTRRDPLADVHDPIELAARIPRPYESRPR